MNFKYFLNEAAKTTVQPLDKDDLLRIIKDTIEKEGPKCDLNFIDTQYIDDMSHLFEGNPFNGDISKWDVSQVKNMASMFEGSKFNGDISKWNTSNVKYMNCMFQASDFNGDISKWNTSNVKSMVRMFCDSKFNKDISKWDVRNVKDMEFMFYNSAFNKNISNWNVSSFKYMKSMFKRSPLEGNEPDWYSVNESDISRSLDEDDIKDSILKRMKKMFHDVKTDIRVIDMDSYFSVRFTVYDDYEAKAYGGIASWKKWLKEDLDIDPKSVEGSKTRHLGSAGGFDYAMRIKK